MKKSIVIGGLGFIGLHLVRELLKKNRQVLVIDKKKYPKIKFKSSVKLITNNCQDKNSLKKVLKKADEVINLVYATVPKTSYENPIYDIKANLPATVNLFDILSEVLPKKVIHISSGGVIYGKTKSSSIIESHRKQPISPYGITKLALENYGYLYFYAKKLPVIFVRPSNSYGPGQYPFTNQGLIATLMGSAIKNKSVDVYGEDVVRDYIYVTDLVKAIIALLDKGKPGEAYNVGSGTGLSNAQIINKIRYIVKKDKYKLKINYQSPRPYDVPKNILNTQKIFKASGWQTKTKLFKGLKITWQWIKTQFN